MTEERNFGDIELKYMAWLSGLIGKAIEAYLKGCQLRVKVQIDRLEGNTVEISSEVVLYGPTGEVILRGDHSQYRETF